MSKTSDQTYPMASSFKVSHLKDGLRISCLPVADELFDLIGRVTAHWGSFEFHFNKVLAAFVSAYDDEVPEKQQRGHFKGRKTLLLKAAASLFTENDIADLRKTCGTAADLHWQRNVVVHGAYAMTLQPGSSEATFRAEGVVGGRKVSINLDRPTLEKLWHEIAHLDAAFQQAVAPLCEIEGYWPTLPDSEILRVYRETNHPWNPNPDKRTPPPRGG